MYFNNELSNLKDRLLSTVQDQNYSDVTRDRINFFLWDLKFLDCFLHLKRLPFASECGMLKVSQKIIEIWKFQCKPYDCPDLFPYKTLYVYDSFGYWKDVIWKTKQEFRAEYSFPNTSLAANKVDDDVSPKSVMEVIDVFVENLNVLVNINDPISWLFVPEHKEQIEQVLKELKLLRFFVCFVSNKCSIQPQYRHTTFYIHALIEASHIAMVVWLHLPVVYGNQDVAPSEVSRLLSDFMELKIKSIQPVISRNNIYIDVLQALKSTIPQAQKKHAAKSGIVETPTHNLMVGLSDQMANLQEMLCLLRDNLIHLPILDLDFHLQDMDSVIIDAGLLIYSLYDIKREKEDTVLDDMNRALGFDLPRNIEPIKAMVYLIMQKAFQRNLPRIHGLGYVDQSYHVLPCHLKSCFLYFGAFLEDRVIDISRLIRLWISESFIKSCEGRRLEDIAEGYLENLIERNLVMVTQRADSDGKVTACRLHDVLLDFCKERAAEENFLLWIKRDQITKAVDSHKQHAHLAFTEIDNLLEWSTSGSLVGSVLFKNYDQYFADRPFFSHAFEISHILPHFKFLKVLDLEHQVVIDFIPTELPYLRYFSALIDQNSIPSSISNLWNLETLILKRRSAARYNRVLLPSTVWDMVKLRYLYIPYFSPENKKALLENSPKLDDLETLSNSYFTRVEDAELMLRKTPNLRNLTCKIECLEYPHQYHALNFPIRLEILKLYGSKIVKTIPFYISAPNLKYLILCGFYLDSQYLSETADHLKNLEVLRLSFVIFGGHMKWKVSNGKFPQLKILKLEYLPMMKWIVADDAFPNLEQLVLRRCHDLMEIPSCFMNILSLQYIEVENCNESVVKSAMNIQETQVEDNQNTNFKLVLIEKETYPRHLNNYFYFQG